MPVYTDMTQNGYLRLNSGDFLRGLAMAILSGILLPLSAAIQTPGFSIATVNWHAVVVLAINGAIIGFVGYIIKNLATNDEGKVLGALG